MNLTLLTIPTLLALLTHYNTRITYNSYNASISYTRIKINK